MSIIVVGSINADLAVQVHRHPKPGETLMGSGGTITPGGKGANQAVAAALQGASVRFVGAVGNDAYATPALRYLTKSGVDLTGISHVEDTTGLAVIAISADGENTIIVIPGANAWVDAGAVKQHTTDIAAADIVLLQGEIPAEGFQAAVDAATHRVVINLAPVVPVDRDALLQADPLMANEHEAALVLQQLGYEVAEEDSKNPEKLAADLLDAGFASVVLTLGAAGALVATPEGNELVPSPKVTAVDTTGAGDAFAGALVARLDAGDSLLDAAHHAVRVAAYAVTGRGAQDSYPTKDDQLPQV
ncbi:ribokinase [Corynebacterium matruchotii]|uniref:ribokinase n=1 Tax=Corynebacterium matruchotii TaxID=43768 RepID=UPI00288C4FA5|nr:ribokinase [Corynebacterium matruchotii]